MTQPELQRSSTSEKLVRAASSASILAHHTAKPLGIASVVGLSVIGSAAFGSDIVGGDMMAKDQTNPIGAGLFVLGLVGCSIFTLVIYLEMKWYKNPYGSTWYERYKDTPGVMLFQLSVTLSFMSFVYHLINLYLEKSGCSILCSPLRYWPNTMIESMYKIAYYFHIYPAFFIAVLGPLQFLEKVRKFKGFLLHRWFGRILLTVSVFHQASATAMYIYSLGWSAFPDETETGHLPFLLYVMSFPLYNIYAWSAIIIGWPAAVRKDIRLHGAMMHRLGAMWFSIVIAFRILPIYLIGMLAAMGIHQNWGLALSAYVVFFACAGATEWYVRKAGCFEPVGTHAREGTCPFLAAQN